MQVWQGIPGRWYKEHAGEANIPQDEFKMIEQHEDSMSHFCTLISLHCTSISTGSCNKRHFLLTVHTVPTSWVMSGQGVQGAYRGTRGLRCRNIPVDKVLVTSHAGQLNMFSTAPSPTAVPRSFDSDHSLICDYHHTFCGLRDWLLTNNPCESIIVESLLNNQSHE